MSSPNLRGASGTAAPRTTVVLVRHGKTVWNQEGRLQGHLDSQLLEEGERGALLLGRRIRTDPTLTDITAVYTSDLGRARHTAEMIMLESALADSNVPLIRDARLREQNFGALEGVHESQLTTEQKNALAMLSFTVPLPGGESFAEVAARLSEAIGKIARAHPDETVLVVTHGAAMMAWLHVALRMNVDAINGRSRGVLEMRNTAVNIVTVETKDNAQDVVKLRTFGDISHQEQGCLGRKGCEGGFGESSRLWISIGALLVFALGYVSGRRARL